MYIIEGIIKNFHIIVQGTTVFDVWFRVDARPFKQALLTIIKRWSFMFKQHLIDHVTNRWVQSANILSNHFIISDVISILCNVYNISSEFPRCDVCLLCLT